MYAVNSNTVVTLILHKNSKLHHVWYLPNKSKQLLVLTGTIANIFANYLNLHTPNFNILSSLPGSSVGRALGFGPKSHGFESASHPRSVTGQSLQW